MVFGLLLGAWHRSGSTPILDETSKRNEKKNKNENPEDQICANSETASSLYPLLPSELIKIILSYKSVFFSYFPVQISYQYSADYVNEEGTFLCPIPSCSKSLKWRVTGLWHDDFPSFLKDHILSHKEIDQQSIQVYNDYGKRLF